MHRYCTTALLIMLFLSGCVTTQSLLLKHNPEDIHKDKIQVGNKIIPLPDGRWKVIARGVKNDFFKIFLVKDHSDKKFSFIRIVVDTPNKSADGGYKEINTLKRTNMLYVKNNANDGGGKTDGWCVNHFIPHFDPNRKHPIFREATEYLKSNGYVLSNEMITVQHFLRSDHFKRRYLDVKYYYNPESEGFAPSKNIKWVTSDWHSMRIGTSPKKLAFVEKLTKEHIEMHKKIQLGFE